MENVFYFPFLFKGGRVTLTVEESVEMLHLLSGFDSDFSSAVCNSCG